MSSEYGTWQPAPPSKPKRRWPWIVTGVAAILIAVSIGAAMNTPTGAGAPVGTPSTWTNSATQAAAPAPSAANFTISLITKSKQCFGEVGCILEVQPDVSYGGNLSDLTGVTCDITYVITGDSSGPVTNTLESDGTRFNSVPTELQTPEGSVTPTVSIRTATCS
jgi:hypothetical protein